MRVLGEGRLTGEGAWGGEGRVTGEGVWGG